MLPSKSVPLAIAALLTVCALPARAAGSFVANAVFDRLDTNHDGVFSKEEIEAARQKIFDRIDANHDGVATSDEIEAFKVEARQRAAKRLARFADRMQQMPSPAERMAAMDTNHDGKISREEFVDRSMPWFGELAKDGNGVTRAEFDAFISGRD